MPRLLPSCQPIASAWSIYSAQRRHTCGKMRLYENRTARAPSPSELDTIWPLQPTALPLCWLQPPVPVPPRRCRRQHPPHPRGNVSTTTTTTTTPRQATSSHPLPASRCTDAIPQRTRLAELRFLLTLCAPHAASQPLGSFDCTHVAVALRQALVEAGRWCSMRALAASVAWTARPPSRAYRGSEPVARQLTVGRHSITIFEQQGDYATRVWLSSIELSAWLTRHAASFAGKRALELGANMSIRWRSQWTVAKERGRMRRRVRHRRRRPLSPPTSPTKGYASCSSGPRQRLAQPRVPGV